MKIKLKKKFLMVLPLLIIMLTFGYGASHMTIVHADDMTSAASSALNSSSSSASSDSSDTSDSSDSSDLSSSSGSTDYSQLQIPSRLATAYHDGYQKVISSSKDDQAKELEIFKNNVTKIINSKNDDGEPTISPVGTLFGSIGLSTASGTSNITQIAKVNKDQINAYLGGTSGIGGQYWKFGRAYTNLVSDATSVSPSSLGLTHTADSVSGLAAVVSNIGVEILKDFSPAPIILAFNDSSVLDSATYSNNKLIILIKKSSTLIDIISFFGDPAPGFPQVSMATAITIAIIIFTSGLALLSIFMNGRQFGMSFRKTMVKILVVSLAIPVAAKVYDVGLNTVDSIVSGQMESKTEQTLQKNLDISDWAQGANFGLPAGMTISIADNRFSLSGAQIEAINLYSAYMSGIISSSDYNNGSVSTSVKDTVASHMLNSTADNNNKTTIKWTEAIHANSSNSPWYTDTYNAVATALGANTKLDSIDKSDADDDPSTSGYIQYGGLYSTDGGKSFTMSNKVTDGLSPVAAFNMMNTTFDQTGFSVNSNLENPTIPVIAIGADTYASGDNIDVQPPMGTLLKFIVTLAMLFASIGALARIVTSGFGGMIHGGGASVFGSAAGAGELIGGIIAVIGGVLGLSLLIVILQNMLDIAWGVVYDAIHSMLKAAVNVNDLKPPTSLLGWIGKIPWLGDMLRSAFTTIVSFFMTLVAMLLLPKFIKVPIEAFGTWISSLPGFLSEKAQAMENQFTGDYRAGGRSSGGHITAAAKNAKAKASAQSKAMKGGALMTGGAVLNHFLANKSSESVAGDDGNKINDSKSLTDKIGGIGTGDDKKDSVTDSKASESKENSKEIQDQKPENKEENSGKPEDSGNEIDGNKIDSSAIEKGVDGTNLTKELDDSTTPTSIDDSESVTNGDEISDDKGTAEENGKELPDGTETPSESNSGESATPEGTPVSEPSASDSATPEGQAMTEDGSDATSTPEGQDVKEPDSADSATPEGTDDAKSDVDADAKAAESLAADESSQLNESKTSEGNKITDSKAGDSVTSEENKSNENASSSENTDNSQKTQNNDGAKLGDSNAESVAVTGGNASDSLSNDNTMENNSDTQDNSKTDASDRSKTDSVSDTTSASKTNSQNNATSVGGASSVTNKEAVKSSPSAREAAASSASKGTQSSASTASTSDRAAATSAKAARLISGLKNSTLVKDMTNQNRGAVSNKEQAMMGMAHMAAGAVGAQAVTQHGVNNINARKGAGRTSSASTSPSTAQQTAREAQQKENNIRMMEEQDKQSRTRTVASSSSTKQTQITKQNATKAKKPFLQTINRKSKLGK